MQNTICIYLVVQVIEHEKAYSNMHHKVPKPKVGAILQFWESIINGLNNSLEM